MDDVAGAASCREEDLCQVLEFASSCFKIDWASVIVGRKRTVFAFFFYFVLEDNFPSTSPWGAYIWRGEYMEGPISEVYGRLD